MKHKMFLFSAAILLLLSYSNPVRAGEITVNWRVQTDSNQISDSTKIYDLKFMPGQESFIIVTGSSLQVRSCEDGTVVKSVPIPYISAAHNIEFTPDSTRLILAYADKIEIREIENFSVLKSYTIPKDEEEFSVRFYEMKVDPIRPYIYTIRNRQKNVLGNLVRYRKILIFDRETLQPVGELTTAEDEKLLLANLAISKDGKYLAAMNNKVSKLIVWTLDTRQKVVDKYISDQNSDKWSSSADIKFSELNTDIIFFTGQFYRKNNEELTGLCIYSIKENRIIDSTFAIQPNSIGGNPKIYLFENETKFIASNGVYLNVLNLIEKKFELKKDILGVNRMALGNFNYHNFEKYFIGGGGELIDKFNYQPNTSVPLENPKEIIYPNPTSGFVNIPLNCINSSRYEIYNTSGRLINSNEITNTANNLLTIDFSQYPAGMYSVKVYCGKQISQYQVLKEG